MTNQFGKDNSKKDTSRFNEFLIELGIGTMAAKNAHGLADAIAQSAGPAFKSYTKAKQQDKENILEETKLDIQKEQNKILADYQKLVLESKGAGHLTGSDKVKLLQAASMSPEKSVLARQYFNWYVKDPKDKRLPSLISPDNVKPYNSEITGFGLFSRDVDEWDDLTSEGQSFFLQVAENEVYNNMLKATSPGGQPTPPTPTMGASVAGDDTLERLLAQQQRLLKANQGK